jgi:hypothetical protein
MADILSTKLLHINRINVPSDILNIIKSFVFYNIDKEKEKHFALHSNSIKILKQVNLKYFNSFYREYAIYRSFVIPNCTITMAELCEICGGFLMCDTGFDYRIACFCDIADNPVVL